MHQHHIQRHALEARPSNKQNNIRLRGLGRRLIIAFEPGSGFLAQQVRASKRYRHICRKTRSSSIAQQDHHPEGTSGRRDWFFKNSDGLKLEVISLEHKTSDKPVLLFIHGAGHGAWCWQENFMPYFYEKGFTSHAISLRGQAKSEAPESKSGGTLDDHSGDLSFFIESQLKAPPILIGHSFGGLISQAYVLRDYKGKSPVQALALLAAAPPQGSNAMIGRFFRRRPLQAIMLTWSFITKSYIKNTTGARRLFFSGDLPEDKVQRYLELLQKNKSKIPAVDISKIKEVTPLPACDASTPPVLVLGGDNDYSVDIDGLQETADHYGVQPVILPGLAHDMMLDTRWEAVAETLLEWVDKLPEASAHTRAQK